MLNFLIFLVTMLSVESAKVGEVFVHKIHIFLILMWFDASDLICPLIRMKDSKNMSRQYGGA